MSDNFNPLESKLLFADPKRMHVLSAWTEHVPFAMLLVELQRPRAIAELGTHWGVSYCAFCQAVETIGTQTRCYAVDTWSGDPHAGYYGNEVHENLKEHHKQYESFSKLLRMTFNEALQHVPDRSLDLLHIDGLHTYEAVKQDYDTWLPKMSEKGIVLFHDTAETERGFGVYKLWDELALKFPNFNFKHGHGLGVLLVGKDQPQAVINFVETANKQDWVRELFAALGRRFQLETQLKEANTEVNRLRSVEHSQKMEINGLNDRLNGLKLSLDYRLGRKIVAPLRKVKRLFDGKAQSPQE